jgi:hypothetical protein
MKSFAARACSLNKCVQPANQNDCEALQILLRMAVVSPAYQHRNLTVRKHLRGLATK